jgi:hypothetical protein
MPASSAVSSRESLSLSQGLTTVTVTDWGNGIKHLDVWTGSSTTNGGQSQINCEDALTPNAQAVVRSPPTNLPVDCKTIVLLTAVRISLTSIQQRHSTVAASVRHLIHTLAPLVAVVVVPPHRHLRRRPAVRPGVAGQDIASVSSFESRFFSRKLLTFPTGCACQTYDDCSDNYVCTNGLCASS